MIPNTLQQYITALIRPNYSPEVQVRRQWLLEQMDLIATDISDSLHREGHLAARRDIREEYQCRTQPFFDELLRIEQVQTSLIVELS